MPFWQIGKRFKRTAYRLGQRLSRNPGRHRIDWLDRLDFRPFGLCADPVGMGDLEFTAVMVNLARNNPLFANRKHVIQVFCPRIEKRQNKRTALGFTDHTIGTTTVGCRVMAFDPDIHGNDRSVDGVRKVRRKPAINDARWQMPQKIGDMFSADQARDQWL